MHTLEGSPILENYNNLLVKGKEQHAWKVLHEFFEFFEEDSSREYLWYMLVAALKNNSETINARHRSNMIFFYEYCIALFKAADHLHKKQQRKITKKK